MAELRSRKIRLRVNETEKQLLEQLFGYSHWAYNNAIELHEEDNSKNNRNSLIPLFTAEAKATP